MSVEWYKLSFGDALKEIGSSAETGLTSAEAEKRLQQYGPNELEEKQGRTRLEIIWEQFANILTVLLVIAAAVSMFLGDWVEAIAILIIVILNGVLGYTQEYRAEQSMAALKRMSVPTVRVRRDGGIKEVSAVSLVPGDIVVLETGNIVPADGRVINSVNMRVEEAALTGESEPVEKDHKLIFESDQPLGDRKNMIFSGTLVNYGRGEFAVTSTGMDTELGHIANLIQGVEEESTPLQARLNKLGRTLAWAALVLVAVVFVLGLIREGTENLNELLLTAVSLAVAAIPEALTAVVTIALSLGAQRMLKRKALIRRLPAVETLGSVTVICSDKTGTLTLNRMTVTALDMANHRYNYVHSDETNQLEIVEVEGAETGQSKNPTLDLLLMGGALNSDATLSREGDAISSIGDPTEAALVVAAALSGIDKNELEAGFPRVIEVPFDSVRKRMTTLHSVPSNQADLPASLEPIWEGVYNGTDNMTIPPYLAFTKGAIDGLLNISPYVWEEGHIHPLDDAWRGRIMSAHDDMAAKGMRVLGVAIRGWDETPAETTEDELERELIFLGMFGMIDPPRPEVKEAVAQCKAAGIRPVMITGDHPLTARHIAQQIGISDNDHFITGQELDRLTPEELQDRARDTAVFARVSPEHKLRLIDVYQGQENIVSMTGDGVNDAPALKKADIGVAMGITGTDVSKETAAMVLTDDNYASIVSAVEEGRVIYANIRKFVYYLLSCNVGEILVIFLATLAGWPLPLTAIQLLVLNLLTDGAPALALGLEKGDPDIMGRPPRRPEEPVINREMTIGIVIQAIAITVAVLAVFRIGVSWYPDNLQRAQTMAFATLSISELLRAYTARSEHYSVFHIGLWGNRYMQVAVAASLAILLAIIYVPALDPIFNATFLGLSEWLVMLPFIFLPAIVAELTKIPFRRRQERELAALAA